MKYTPSQIIEQRISIKGESNGKPITKEQHDKMCKAFGFNWYFYKSGGGHFRPYSVRPGDPYGDQSINYMSRCDEYRPSMQITYDEIDFGDEPFYYAAPCDMKAWGVKKGQKFVKVEAESGDYYTNGASSFPAELVERFFDRISEPRTIELHGVFTKQMLEEKIKEIV